MQIDESEEQLQNAYSSMDDSLEPGSNVTVEREWDASKQYFSTLSTEEGMQIDESDEQYQNADSPTDERLESDSNVTVERDSHRQKHPTSNRSIDFGIVTSRLLPKYNFSRTHSKSRRNAPQTLKCRFSSEIEISCRLRSADFQPQQKSLADSEHQSRICPILEGRVECKMTKVMNSPKMHIRR
jgi:hypothetical protein